VKSDKKSLFTIVIICINNKWKMQSFKEVSRLNLQ
jgi:hypothetical protein